MDARNRAAAMLALAWVLGASAAAPRYGFEVERSTLDNGTPDWTISRLRIDAIGNADTWFAVGLEDRFGFSDVTFATGSAWRVTEATRFEFDIGGSPTCDVAACATGRLGLAHRLAKGLEVRGGYRRTDYDLDVTSVLDVGVEWYVGAERLAYTAFVGELAVGPTATSHFVQWDHELGDRASFGAFLVDGDEVTRVDPTLVVAAPIESYGVRLKLPLGDRLVLELGAEHHAQGPYYDRDALRVGVRRAF